MRSKRQRIRIRDDTVRRSKRKVEKSYIKNAKHQTIDGIEFKSNLEAFCYQSLKDENLIFQYEPTSYVLIPPFEHDGQKVRAAKYKPDFVGPSFELNETRWIIETKGFETDAFKLRWKLFKKYLYDNNLDIKLYLPRNKVQVKETIELIKQLMNDN